MVLQLFVRDNVPADFGENVYMVCGLVKSETPLDGECIHLLQGQLNEVECKNVASMSEGENLDGVMTSPLWRKFVVKEK